MKKQSKKFALKKPISKFKLDKTVVSNFDTKNVKGGGHKTLKGCTVTCSWYPDCASRYLPATEFPRP